MLASHFAFAALTALLLVGCAAPTQSPDAPKAAVETAPVSQPAVGAPVATPAPPLPQQQEPVAQVPDTTGNKTVIDASNPSRSCKTDSDCAVKDVGNCCGAYPMCVNKDTRTDPGAVRAQCAKDGMASVCGFQEISGCQCVEGRCENLGNGPAVM